MNVHMVYQRHINEPYRADYAATVKRFQEGFLHDKVCDDPYWAFVRAVETTERLIPVIKARHAA